METKTRLGDLIRDARKYKGFTQTELGDLVGMSQRWVSDLERGETDVPKRAHLHSLSEHLGIDLSELYIAADLARSETEAQRASESAPPVDPNDPLLNVVYAGLRKLEHKDLVSIRDIVLRLSREE